jgi:hypothetical protein
MNCLLGELLNAGLPSAPKVFQLSTLTLRALVYGYSTPAKLSERASY